MCCRACPALSFMIARHIAIIGNLEANNDDKDEDSGDFELGVQDEV